MNDDDLNVKLTLWLPPEPEVSYPQPYEGISGTDRSGDRLLSLSEADMPVRAMVMQLAYRQHGAALNDRDKSLWYRMGEPEIGELVFEMTRGIMTLRPDRMKSPTDFEYRALGYLLADREEWTESDEDWAKIQAERPEESDKRWHDHVSYVQYGPAPEDVCRWQNHRLVAVPTDLWWPRRGPVQ